MRDITYSKIDIHKFDLDTWKNHFKDKCPEEHKHVIEFLRLLSIGDISKGKRIGVNRQWKYLVLLPIFIKNVKKPLDKLTKADTQKFIENLNSNKILTIKENRPYSEATKRDIMLLTRAYLKWRLPKKYLELTDFFDLRKKESTPDYLTEGEIEKLYDACVDNSRRAMISLWFDSGGRIAELLNIRHEDITYPTESFPYFMIDFKVEYSKTKGRKIGMYWKNTTKDLMEYLANLKDKSPEKPIFPDSYGSYRMFVSRLGRRILNRKVNNKLFRNSSATYYANKLNRQELCIRYGWRFSSRMPDVYIARSGMDEIKVKDVMLNTDLNKINKENQELRTQLALVQDKSVKTNEELQIIKNRLETFSEATKIADEFLKSRKYIDFVAKAYKDFSEPFNKRLAGYKIIDGKKVVIARYKDGKMVKVEEMKKRDKINEIYN